MTTYNRFHEIYIILYLVIKNSTMSYSALTFAFGQGHNFALKSGVHSSSSSSPLLPFPRLSLDLCCKATPLNPATRLESAEWYLLAQQSNIQGIKAAVSPVQYCRHCTNESHPKKLHIMYRRSLSSPKSVGTFNSPKWGCPPELKTLLLGDISLLLSNLVKTRQFKQKLTVAAATKYKW